ncbi:UDP-glucose 4-epimerase [Frondihabitans sucicola]|uniref:UDP-glucose 4-epimerase n=1 Tax=Frondihabitans sucicola TaxID=1268041 RepID=A0ABN6XV67_9MICO|nr:UDP-glucose 4-epimerase [Frondihabitans sucicola]
MGSAVTAGLRSRGHTVVAIDRRPPSDAARALRDYADALETPATPDPFEFIEEVRTVDLASYAETREALADAEAVVHLAGINNPLSAPGWEVHDNNVVASYHVLSAAAELGISRVVQSSSVNAIGLSWSRAPRFDYFPVDLAHATRNEDAYSLSKLVQEVQADSLTRRFESTSVVSLRLHAVLNDASDAQAYVDRFGVDWAVNGLFGYCTISSTVDAVVLACEAEVTGHERLWVVEPETFVSAPSGELAARYYPDVTVRGPLDGRSAFFDASRTVEVLGWTPSTVVDPPAALVDLGLGRDAAAEATTEGSR